MEFSVWTAATQDEAREWISFWNQILKLVFSGKITFLICLQEHEISSIYSSIFTLIGQVEIAFRKDLSSWGSSLWYVNLSNNFPSCLWRRHYIPAMKYSQDCVKQEKNSKIFSNNVKYKILSKHLPSSILDFRHENEWCCFILR